MDNAKAIERDLLEMQSGLLAVRADLQADLDSMNEMSEMVSMRLQMAMDRRSKFVETLSNVLKKIADTQDAIVQNMK
jgi:hypothetical protein